MASDENNDRCQVCDRVKERGGCEVEVTLHSKRRYGDDNLRARRDCDQHSVDWRARALAAEAQRDSLEPAIAQAKQAADFDRISFGAMRARIAELESALAAVTEGKDRWRKAATGLSAKWSSHVKRIAELEATVERMREFAQACSDLPCLHGPIGNGPCRLEDFDDPGEFCLPHRARRLLPAAPVAGDAAELLQSANLGRVSNMSAQCERCPRTVVVAMTHAGPVLCATCIDAAPVHPTAEEGTGPACGPLTRVSASSAVTGTAYICSCGAFVETWTSHACPMAIAPFGVTPDRAAIEAEVEARVVEEVAAYFEETHDIVSGMPVTVLMGDIADDVRAGKWRTK